YNRPMPFPCPKCGHSANDGAQDCSVCGINFLGFAKYEKRAAGIKKSDDDGSLPMVSDVAVYVKQDESALQIITGLQTRNHYTLYDNRGIQIGFLAERNTGMLSDFQRMLLRSRRSFLMDVYDPSGKIVASLSRPFYWFLSELTIDVAGRRV